MATPEGKVKNKVKRVLKKHEDHIYQFWPVQSGYGAKSLDCLGWYAGFAFAIETKAPGKKPTAQQNQTIREMKKAGAKVFVIDGDTTELEEWLDMRNTYIAIQNKIIGEGKL